jgi:hypothetical protein
MHWKRERKRGDSMHIWLEKAKRLLKGTQEEIESVPHRV